MISFLFAHSGNPNTQAVRSVSFAWVQAVLFAPPFLFNVVKKNHISHNHFFYFTFFTRWYIYIFTKLEMRWNQRGEWICFATFVDWSSDGDVGIIYLISWQKGWYFFILLSLNSVTNIVFCSFTLSIVKSKIINGYFFSICRYERTRWRFNTFSSVTCFHIVHEECQYCWHLLRLLLCRSLTNFDCLFLVKGSILGAKLQKFNDKGKPCVIQVDSSFISLSNIGFLLLVLSCEREEREDRAILCQYLNNDYQLFSTSLYSSYR